MLGEFGARHNPSNHEELSSPVFEDTAVRRRERETTFLTFLSYEKVVVSSNGEELNPSWLEGSGTSSLSLSYAQRYLQTAGNLTLYA